jgi:broad specificity phosphatase PhoE
MTRLILIRHGETEHNRGNVTLGRADVPLTDRGIAQARAAAAAFTRSPDAIYTSPLSRALRTAEIIGAQAGRTPIVEDALIEMDVGEMEHLTGAELRERYPEFLRVWMSGDCADARMPGGETLREVQGRAWAAAERIAAEHTGATVIAVTHNFVISMLVCYTLGLPIAGFRRMRPALGSRTVIDLGEQGPMLVRFNDISHLLAAGLADDSMREARR